MAPWQLSGYAHSAFVAGQCRAWRDEFMKLAKERASARSTANCVGFARKYHRKYLRSLAAALGKEFPQ